MKYLLLGEPMDEKLRPIETKSFFGRFKNVLTK